MSERRSSAGVVDERLRAGRAAAADRVVRDRHADVRAHRVAQLRPVLAKEVAEILVVRLPPVDEPHAHVRAAPIEGRVGLGDHQVDEGVDVAAPIVVVHILARLRVVVDGEVDLGDRRRGRRIRFLCERLVVDRDAEQDRGKQHRAANRPRGADAEMPMTRRSGQARRAGNPARGSLRRQPAGGSRGASQPPGRCAFPAGGRAVAGRCAFPAGGRAGRGPGQVDRACATPPAARAGCRAAPPPRRAA